METPIYIFLLIYFIIYFGFAFVLKSFMIWKQIGKNPIVLPKDDSVHGLVGKYFKITIILIFLYVLICSIYVGAYQYFSPIFPLQQIYIRYIGVFLLGVAFLITILAQSHIRNSWRIGIDTETKTELITTGFFGYSRNPIFLGMILSLIGLFLVIPNTATLIFLIIGYILIQIQVRLEEDFLEKQHGEVYLQYKDTVRRFI